jgi:flagellar biosynthesis anti-sigma factor FlgM
MKINDANVAGLASPGIGKTQEAEQGARLRQGRTGDGTSSSTDQVQLSNLSETLRASDSESPERAAQVERLSADVQAGRYHVDSAKVSNKIVQDSITG